MSPTGGMILITSVSHNTSHAVTCNKEKSRFAIYLDMVAI